MHTLTELIQRWRRENRVILPGEPEARVREVLARLGSQATPDVIALYGAIGGLPDQSSELWHLWSLAQVEAGNPERSKFGVFFSDYLIGAWCYRLRPTGNGTSEVYMEDPPQLVASSLAEFFDEYLRLDGPPPWGGL